MARTHGQCEVNVLILCNCHLDVSLDYTYYETLASQQQCQISCCLITHPANVPTTMCELSDMPVSAQIPLKMHRSVGIFALLDSEIFVFQHQPWHQVMPDVPLSHTTMNESPHFISVLPSARGSKGKDLSRSADPSQPFSGGSLH